MDLEEILEETKNIIQKYLFFEKSYPQGYILTRFFEL